MAGRAAGGRTDLVHGHRGGILGRRLDVEPLEEGSLVQTVIVGDKHGELGPDRQGSREMQGVERAQLHGIQIAGTVEQRLIEADEMDRTE